MEQSAKLGRILWLSFKLLIFFCYSFNIVFQKDYIFTVKSRNEHKVKNVIRIIAKINADIDQRTVLSPLPKKSEVLFYTVSDYLFLNDYQQLLQISDTGYC